MSRFHVSAQVDIFNMLNGNPVLGVRNSNFGVAGFRVPSDVLQARLVKASATFTF